MQKHVGQVSAVQHLPRTLVWTSIIFALRISKIHWCQGGANEADSSDADSELAMELFQDYMSGVSWLDFSTHMFLHPGKQGSVTTILGRICKAYYQDSCYDLPGSKETMLGL